MTNARESDSPSLEGARLLDRGAQAEIYEWGEGRVLRLVLEGGGNAETLAREAAMMRAASAAGVPVPRVHEVLTVNGRPGLVMDRVEGGPMLSTMLGRPWRLLPLIRRFGEIHAQIHGTTAPAGGNDLHEVVASRLDRLDAADARLGDWARLELEQLPRGSALLHGDYHPLNLLMAGPDPVVIDWPGSSAGPIEADVALTTVLIEAASPPNGSPLMLKLMGTLRTRLFVPLYLRAYGRSGELDRPTMKRWRMVRVIERLAMGPPNEERALREIIRRSGGPRDF